VIDHFGPDKGLAALAVRQHFWGQIHLRAATCLETANGELFSKTLIPAALPTKYFTPNQHVRLSSPFCSSFAGGIAVKDWRIIHDGKITVVNNKIPDKPGWWAYEFQKFCVKNEYGAPLNLVSKPRYSVSICPASLLTNSRSFLVRC